MAEHEHAPVDYDSGEHEVTRAEHDRPHNPMILALVIATVASLIIIVLAVMQFFDVSVRSEIDRKVLQVPSTALRELRATESSKLSGYLWVDQQKGIVRIPLERAIELTARDWESRPSGLVEVKDIAPPAAAPDAGAPAAPAPGAAPAPAPGAAPAAGTPPAPSTQGTPPLEGGKPK